MFICLDCGKVFENPKMEKEYRGECFGYPSYEAISYCPYCEGDYEEAEECERCENFFNCESIEQGLCDCCRAEILTKYKRDAKAVYQKTKEEKQKIEINSFLAYCFDENDIETILLKTLEEKEELDTMFGGIFKEDYSDFISDDFEQFKD